MDQALAGDITYFIRKLRLNAHFDRSDGLLQQADAMEQIADKLEAMLNKRGYCHSNGSYPRGLGWRVIAPLPICI